MKCCCIELFYYSLSCRYYREIELILGDGVERKRVVRMLGVDFKELEDDILKILNNIMICLE